MRGLLLTFLSAVVAAILAVGSAHALGLGYTASLLWLGLCLGLAPRWPIRQPKPADGQSPALVIDPTGEIAYLRVREGKHHRTVADVHSVNVDFDQQGNLLGVEFVSWPPNEMGPAVPQAWPPYDGYEDEEEDEDDDEGEEWKQ